MTLRLKGTDYHAVVFDCDGVLVDSEHAWGLAEAALCDAFDVEYTAAVASQTTGVGLKDAVSVLLAAAQHPVDLSYAYQLMRDLAEAHVPPATHPIPDAQRVVQLLGSLLPIGVASNSEQPLLDRILAKIGLADEFHAVVSASEVDAPKPAPDVYVLSAERLEVHPHHTIVVEDSHTGWPRPDPQAVTSLASASTGHLWTGACRAIWHCSTCSSQQKTQHCPQRGIPMLALYVDSADRARAEPLLRSAAVAAFERAATALELGTP